MYTLETLRKILSEEGTDNFIMCLTSGELTQEHINQLTDLHILRDGYPNLSVIYSII
jgi:hypothetical protein